MEKIILCPKCKKNAATEKHQCPFKADIHDNYELCTCCEDCQYECYEET